MVVAAACFGCSDGEPGNVSGAWCGNDVATASACVGDDEVFYLELAQAGGVVTGDWCEAYNKDCLPIEDGTFTDGMFTFHALVETTSTVTGLFTLSGDGERLAGKFALTANNSDDVVVSVRATLHRID